MATPAEKQRIDKVRLRVDQVGKDWSIEADDNGLHLFASDPTDGAVEPVAIIADTISFANQDFILNAASDLAFILMMFDRCQAYVVKNCARTPKSPKPKNFATECAIKCQTDQAFRRYLIECHSLVDAGDAERIKTKVRFILNVTSLAELNSDPNAAARWEKLRGDFYQWMNRP
jgi:hypothetical protein